MQHRYIETNQNGNTIYTFSIKAVELLKYVHFVSRAEDRENGIQREYKPEKGRMIAQAVLEGDMSIPNSIIVNMLAIENNLDISKIMNNGTIDFDEAATQLSAYGKGLEELFFVIDGQHRLRAFNSLGDIDYELVVTMYLDLNLAQVAELFVQINYYQKPVDKSLVYDFLGINKEIIPEYAKYHKLVECLNQNVDSVMRGEIKMLGTGYGIISQASIITAFAKYKVLERLEEYFVLLDEEAFHSLVCNYFNSISQVFNKEWRNKDTILTKSLGLRTLIKLLPIIVQYSVSHYGARTFDVKEFNEVLGELDNKVKDDLIKRRMIEIKEKQDKKDISIWEYFSTLGIGGEGGISTLYKYFLLTLVENGGRENV